ncbi:MAG: hypothetical protein V1897_05360 [Pseudomonadota bacterium]
MFKILFRLVFIALTFLNSSSFVHSENAEGCKTYKGAWFQIEYPEDFTVKPSLKSSSAKGYDSAFFVSPDESVEFYAFSPQWNGEPSDIQVITKTEQVVSEKTDNVPDTSQKLGTKSVRRYTIAAKDKSYFRSYVDTENKQLNYRFVIGLKYRDMDVYREFHDRYQIFVRSLKQFSD